MPKCQNCGKEHDGNFCPFCGTKAEEQQKSVVIKNETKRDVDFTARMNYYMVGKKNRRMLFISALLFILLAGWIFGYNYLMTNGENSQIGLAIFLLLLGVIIFILALMQKSAMRKAVQKNMQGKEALNSYIFTEEGYEVMTRISDGTTSKTWGNYGSFTEVKEFADMWLLYVNGMTAFPVSKEGMTEGTAEEFTALLTRMTGARYKVCYKVK